MAVSLLGAKTHGTGFPQVFRVVNSAATALGESFATVLLTGAPTGTFVAGESLSFSGGGSATLAQAALTGPNRLVIASPTGTLTGTITGGTSGATASVSTVEGLESTPTTNGKISRAVEYRGSPYVVCYNTIYRLDETLGGSGGRWIESYRFAVTHTTVTTARSKIGLYVLNKGGVPSLATIWTPTGVSNTYRAITSDGVAWTELLITGSGITSAGEQRAAAINNVLYIWGAVAGGTVYSWDPGTDGFASIGGLSGPSVISHAIVATRNRVFCAYQQTAGTFATLAELIGGTFTNIINTSVGSQQTGRTVAWVGNDGFIYALHPGSSSGWFMFKYDVTSNTFTQVTTAVLPVPLRDGGGSSNAGAWDVYVDTETAAPTTDNADAAIYLWHSTSPAVGTPRTTYTFTDDVTPLNLEDSGGAPQEISLPGVPEGGGHRTFFSGEMDFAFTGPPSPIIGGERWSFLIYKKPGTSDVLNVKFRALYRRTIEATKASVPGRWGYISAVSVGSISVGNREVTGLTANSVPGTPGTVYTADILLVSQDGVPNFSRVVRAGLVYL